MKTFKFTCKQNQVSKVVTLLGTFGKPHIELKNGFPVVSVKHNTSNRKIDRFLFESGIPGASPRKNKFRVVKCDKYELAWAKNVSPKEVIKWVCPDSGKMYTAYYTYTTTCDCCGPEFIFHVKTKNGFTRKY